MDWKEFYELMPSPSPEEIKKEIEDLKEWASLIKRCEEKTRQ